MSGLTIKEIMVSNFKRLVYNHGFIKNEKDGIKPDWDRLAEEYGKLIKKDTIDPSFFSQIVRGHRNLGPKVRSVLCQIFACSETEFVRLDFNTISLFEYNETYRKLNEILTHGNASLKEMAIKSVDLFHSQLVKEKKIKQRVVTNKKQ